MHVLTMQDLSKGATWVAGIMKLNRQPIPIKFLPPLYSSKIRAGFPSPADDYIEENLDLNDLIARPSATFFVRVSGNSMQGAGISDGDILIVDRSVSIQTGKIIIAVIDGFLTVKRLLKKNGKVYLCPENSEFSPIELKEENDIHVWGVVTKVIHELL